MVSGIQYTNPHLNSPGFPDGSKLSLIRSVDAWIPSTFEIKMSVLYLILISTTYEIVYKVQQL